MKGSRPVFVALSLVLCVRPAAVRRLKFSTAIVDLAEGRLVDNGPPTPPAPALAAAVAASPAPKEAKEPKEPKEPSAMDLIRRLSLGGTTGTIRRRGEALAPFFTKSYEDMTLFRMPEGLPFTIETVKATETTIRIAGAVQWEAAEN
jgi:hypothetical protein